MNSREQRFHDFHFQYRGFIWNGGFIQFYPVEPKLTGDVTGHPLYVRSMSALRQNDVDRWREIEERQEEYRSLQSENVSYSKDNDIIKIIWAEFDLDKYTHILFDYDQNKYYIEIYSQ